jgi:hypothetical protein
MTIQEGLGYSLRNYNPCFNYNADRFCCSDRGYKFRNNVLLSDCPMTKMSNLPQYNNPNDNRPLFVRLTGIVDPDPYTFTPQDKWNIWCSRMPCSINQKGVPCQQNMPRCENPATCNK